MLRSAFTTLEALFHFKASVLSILKSCDPDLYTENNGDDQR